MVKRLTLELMFPDIRCKSLPAPITELKSMSLIQSSILNFDSTVKREKKKKARLETCHGERTKLHLKNEKHQSLCNLLETE